MLVLLALTSGCGAAKLQPRPPLQSTGKAVFGRMCAACHTLTAREAGASSGEGGDLATARMTPADLTSFVHIMPVHLSAAETAAVVAYVREVQRNVQARSR
jgi:mono/diheme cytochrome c family protein